MGVNNPGTMNMGAMNVQFAESKGNPRVQHREFIGPVFGSTGFTTQVYRIQPGLRGADVLFPWGSSVANCFEQYQLNGMIVEYKTTSTNYSSGVALGSVMMSTVYDAEAPPLTGQLAVDNHEFTTSDVPSCTFIHPIECAKDESSLVTRYVQASNAPSFANDERFNDVGIFQISTVGMPATANNVQVGELWATYDITFLKPALPDIHVGTSALMTAAPSSQPIMLVGASSYSWDQSNSLPVSIINNNTLQLPVGYSGAFQLTLVSSAPMAGNVIPMLLAGWGSDITALKAFPSYINGSSTPGVPFNSAEFFSGGAVVGNYSDITNHASACGYTNVYLFSTIAETLVNNTLTFSRNVGTDVPASITLLITAVDSDLPSGKYGSLPPTNEPQFAVRRRLEQRLLRSADEADRVHTDLESERAKRAALELRLERLESLLSSQTELVPSPTRNVSVETEEEYGISESASAPPASEARTSVHLSRSLMMDLLRRNA